MTTGVPSSTTATQLLVVPRSIPMTFSAIGPLYSALVRTRTQPGPRPRPRLLLQSIQLCGNMTVSRIQIGGALQRPKGLPELASRPEDLAKDSLRGGILRI